MSRLVRSAFVVSAMFAFVPSCSDDDRAPPISVGSGGRTPSGGHARGGVSQADGGALPCDAGAANVAQGGASQAGAGAGGFAAAGSQAGEPGTAGAPLGEGGNGPAPGCPKRPQSYRLSCGASATQLMPSYDPESNQIVLDISAFEPPIVGGDVTVFAEYDGLSDCGSVRIGLDGTRATALLPFELNGAILLRIADFVLKDGCGNEHRFYPNGPVCNELRATPSETQGVNFDCAEQDGACPDVCE